MPESADINVHLTNGRTAKFAQPDKMAMIEILRHINPARFFTQRTLMVAGVNCLTVFQASAVERVDFVTTYSPQWPHPADTLDACEITEEELFEKSKQRSSIPNDKGWIPVPGAPFTFYIQLTFTSGEHMTLEITRTIPDILHTPTPIDQSIFVQQFFAMQSIHARKKNGGIILINPSHVFATRIIPGAPTPPLGAWVAEPV